MVPVAALAGAAPPTPTSKATARAAVTATARRVCRNPDDRGRRRWVVAEDVTAAFPFRTLLNRPGAVAAPSTSPLSAGTSGQGRKPAGLNAFRSAPGLP